MGKVKLGVGFGSNQELEPGIYDDVLEEKTYYGEILENRRSFDQGTTLSGDVKITNQFSIMGNTYLFDNLEKIRYVRYRNQLWTVTVDEGYPRVTFNLGGLYHGQAPETT